DPQGNAETVPVSKNDFYRIGGSVRIESNDLVSVLSSRIIPENEASRRRVRGNSPGRANFDRDAAVQLPLPSGNLPGRHETARALAIADGSLDDVTGIFAVEPDTVDLVDGDGATGSETEDVDNLSAGRAQERIFVSALHLGDDQGRHDPDK